MWNICIPNPFMNAELIFPTKQVDVRDIINVVENDRNILKVIIFGSSVTSACNPWSDVDVYYEMLNESYRPCIFTESSIDGWTNFDIPKGEKLLDEIKEKGVLVYERNSIR